MAAREHEAVAARYTNADGSRMAKPPNGEPSNFTERQWVQVRTPSFKRWLGDCEAATELNVLIGLSLEEAREKLKALSGKFPVNLATATGMKAQINTVQRNKIVSASAFRKSKNNGFTANEHNTAVSMIDKLWKHAEQVSDAQDKNGDVNIKSIKRFVSPLLFTGRDVPVYAWLTLRKRNATEAAFTASSLKI